MNVKFLGVVRKFVSIGKEGSNVIVSMVIKRTHMILLDAGKNGINYSWYEVCEIKTTCVFEYHKNKKEI